MCTALLVSLYTLPTRLLTFEDTMLRNTKFSKKKKKQSVEIPSAVALYSTAHSTSDLASNFKGLCLDKSIPQSVEDVDQVS